LRKKRHNYLSDRETRKFHLVSNELAMKNPFLLIKVNAKLKIVSKHLIKIVGEILAWLKVRGAK